MSEIELLYTPYTTMLPLKRIGGRTDKVSLPRNLGIVGSNPTRVTTMIPHIMPVPVGSRKRTRE